MGFERGIELTPTRKIEEELAWHLIPRSHNEPILFAFSNGDIMMN